ncbi:hypothetical protein K443DRAFT_8990, partial [Laccaria amethystina LaAM-08-1]
PHPTNREHGPPPLQHQHPQTAMAGHHDTPQTANMAQHHHLQTATTAHLL